MSTEELEKRLKELHRKTTAEMDEHILEDASEALRESTGEGTSVIKFSTVLKLAVAAVIIITLFISVSVFLTESVQETPIEVAEKPIAPAVERVEQTSPQKVEPELIMVTEQSKPETQRPEQELMMVASLAKAGDVNGLIAVLEQGDALSKIAAANYLAEIGDFRTVIVLEELGEDAQADSNNLFIITAEKIKSRLGIEDELLELEEFEEIPEANVSLVISEVNETEMERIALGISDEAPGEFVGILVEGVNMPSEFEGIVVDENDNPIEGVLVDAWTWYPGNETRTDVNGYFNLGGFKDQKTIEVRFSKENYSPKLYVRQPLGVEDATVVLNNKTYFEGQIQTSDGQPVPEAIIRADQGAKDAEGVVIGSVWTETQSDENGNYRLYVQDDKYDIQVKAESVGVARLQDVVINQNESKHLDIVLDSSITFLAQVLDSNTNEPVEGIRFFHWQHPGVEGVSDINGLVEITGMIPGRFEFNVESDSYARWWSQECLSEWRRFKTDPQQGGWQRNFGALDFNLEVGMEPVTVIVEKGVRIRGVVFDPNGNPVVGATVAPALTGTGNSITGDTRFSFPTNQDGSFEMFLPASKEREYNLIAHDGKFQQWRNWANGLMEPIYTTPGEEVNDVEIWLTEPATVRGRVTDRFGQPMIGSKVHTFAHDKLGNRYYEPITQTDEDGYFELKFIRPGKHYIQASSIWYDAENAPDGISQLVEVAEGQIIEGIELIGVEEGPDF